MTISNDELYAYIDGELPEVRARQIDALAQADEELAAKIAVIATMSGTAEQLREATDARRERTAEARAGGVAPSPAPTGRPVKVRPAFSASLRADVLASVLVSLTALPLSLGIAVASGVPPAMGLLAGVVGGIVVGALSGCPLQVSGPAAGLSVVVYEIVADGKLGLPMLGVIIVLAGLVQSFAGLLRLGQWFRAVSPAVIHGMLAGIGATIFVNQFHVMLDGEPSANTLENLLAIPGAVLEVVTLTGVAGQALAAQIGVLTLGVLILWRRLAPRRLRTVPAPAVAILLATAAAAAWGMPIRHVQMPDNFFATVQLPAGDAWARAFEVPVLIAAVTVAVIASAETLLCATAVDQLHTGPRTKYDRELVAQGVGNTLCGLIGALPLTGVIVRSAVNIEAGGRTRWSTIFLGVLLLLFLAYGAAPLRLVPTASLAAILVYTGYRLVNPHHIRELFHCGKSEVAIYFATLVTIVATDLLKGVLFGVALSFAKITYTFSNLHLRLEETDGRSILYLDGAATFIRLPKLASALEAVPPNAELHVHFEGLSYIDHACLDLLVAWEKQHEATGGSLVIDWDSLTARFRQPVDPSMSLGTRRSPGGPQRRGPGQRKAALRGRSLPFYD